MTTLFCGPVSEETDLIKFCDAVTHLCNNNNNSNANSGVKLRQRALWLSLLQSEMPRNSFEVQLPFLIKHPDLSNHNNHNNSLFTASLSLQLSQNGNSWFLPRDFEHMKTCELPPGCVLALTLSNIRFACKEEIIKSKPTVMPASINSFWANTSKLFNEMTHDP
jgi:hypothetical protein